MELQIRIANLKDLNPILELFRECIFDVCKEHYSKEELNAWASASENSGRWLDKMNKQYFIVAVSGKVITGFASLAGNNIDLLYVHKNFQHYGVGTSLLDKLIAQAKSNSTEVVTAEVSRSALHFFESQGFDLVTEQSKNVNGVTIQNYKMFKGI